MLPHGMYWPLAVFSNMSIARQHSPTPSKKHSPTNTGSEEGRVWHNVAVSSPVVGYLLRGRHRNDCLVAMPGLLTCPV
jgi:hypothetical protein